MQGGWKDFNRNKVDAGLKSIRQSYPLQQVIEARIGAEVVRPEVGLQDPANI
jgi:hypothetical protein